MTARTASCYPTTHAGPFDDTLILVPPTAFDWILLSDETCQWDVPHAFALYNLSRLLGANSRAMVLHDFAFGDENDSSHDLAWHKLFQTLLDTVFFGSMPTIMVEKGQSFYKLHGSAGDDEPEGYRRYMKDLYDRDVADAAPIQLLSRAYWNKESTEAADFTEEVCLEVIRLLHDTGVIQLDTDRRHFRPDLESWLRAAGVRSDRFRRIVVVKGWSNKTPMLGAQIEVPALTVAV